MRRLEEIAMHLREAGMSLVEAANLLDPDEPGGTQMPGRDQTGPSKECEHDGETYMKPFDEYSRYCRKCHLKLYFDCDDNSAKPKA